MRIRPYADADAAATLDIFRRAVRVTAARDYTPVQVAAWAPDDLSLSCWAERRRVAAGVVAVIDERVVGFSDLNDEGYIDMMYVDPDVARTGVATALLTHLITTARARGVAALTTNASVTARPFFEKHGFTVVRTQQPVRRGVALTNFHMRLALEPDPR